MVSGGVTNLDDSGFSLYLDELLEEDVKHEFLLWLQKKVSGNFSYLKHILVEKEFKGQGMGKDLINHFLSSAEGPVVLVCDNLESQNEGFDLQKWYEKQGFNLTGFSTLSGPIMIRFN